MDRRVVQRLGYLLYWTGCAVAGLIVIGAVAEAIGGEGSERVLLPLALVFFAACVWALGQTLRYVLTET